MTLSAFDMVAAVRARSISASELAADALARARAAAHLGAFAHLSDELALSQARAVDDTIAAGGAEDLALPGVPCPIKDLAEVEGLPFEAGSRVLAGNVGKHTDAVAARLIRAGTLTVGKTSAPEFGFPCYTEPAGGLAAVTPWDPTRGAGGSSGGAAAAVAAGIVPIAHASDGGGSIRIPASSCGVVGMKPSRGLVSTLPTRTPGPGLVCDGVISRTVRDTALGLEVVAGNRPGDTYVLPHRRGSLLAACDGQAPSLRVGVLTTPVISRTASVHPVCLDAVERAARLLEDLGHRVQEVGVPFPAERWDAFQAVWTTGAALLPIPDGAETLLTPMTRWLREEGRRVSGTEYATALSAIQELTLETALSWADVDVVLTPTLAQPPARLGALRNDDDPAADFAAQIDYTPWTSIANLTGRPSISLPLHRAEVDDTVLPIGVMLTGRTGFDADLVRLAAQLETADPWPLELPA
nr:amidase [Nigerium massiliense]